MLASDSAWPAWLRPQAYEACAVPPVLVALVAARPTRSYVNAVELPFGCVAAENCPSAR